MDKFSQEILYNAIRRGEDTEDYLYECFNYCDTSTFSFNQLHNLRKSFAKYNTNKHRSWLQNDLIKVIKRLFNG